MRIGILGTGMVGQALATKLAQAGHEVMVGTRDPAATLARDEPHPVYGIPPFSVWYEQHADAKLAGKVLVDIANALDYSQGMPPSLFVANTDSLGERIQRAFRPSGWSRPSTP
jgi:predicted dinucleotide-binding enzyme